MAWRLRCWRRSSQPPSTFNLTNSAGQRLEARLPHGHWRAVARYEAGETTRSIAAALRISPSCVSKWMKLKRETGSLAPGKVGGHKKRMLSGEPAAWLRERCRSGPFTTRGLTAELLGRGIKSDRRAVWVFLHAEGLSFKKNRAAGRADAARHRPQADALEGPSGSG